VYVVDDDVNVVAPVVELFVDREVIASPVVNKLLVSDWPAVTTATLTVEIGSDCSDVTEFAVVVEGQLV